MWWNTRHTCSKYNQRVFIEEYLQVPFSEKTQSIHIQPNHKQITNTIEQYKECILVFDKNAIVLLTMFHCNASFCG